TLPPSPSPLPPFSRYFTPRRSPDPSSPTVAAKRIGRAVRTRAVTTASATATSAAMPRALSEIPGPSSRRPRRSTETSTSGPNTVSRWAESTTGAGTGSWVSRLEITSCMAIRVGGVRHKSQGFLDLAQPPRDTRAMDERELIYDWNRAGPAFDWSRARVDLNDETLRDGLQSPSVRDPSLEVKKRLLHLMADLGIVAADIGLPGAGPRVVEQVRVLAPETRDHTLPI